MNTDPIADMLTRLRNANIVKHAEVKIPYSKLKVKLAELLKNEGYIVDYKVLDNEKFKMISVVLKYGEDKKPVISNLRRISKPGLRIYSKAKNLPRVFGGLGIAIVSTSEGLLPDRKARQKNIGGEILCYVW